MFSLLSTVFDEPAAPLHDDYVEQLLNQDSFWALATFADGELVGGLTAHTLPMTRAHASEPLVTTSRCGPATNVTEPDVTVTCRGQPIAGSALMGLTPCRWITVSERWHVSDAVRNRLRADAV